MTTHVAVSAVLVAMCGCIMIHAFMSQTCCYQMYDRTAQIDSLKSRSLAIFIVYISLS